MFTQLSVQTFTDARPLSPFALPAASCRFSTAQAVRVKMPKF